MNHLYRISVIIPLYNVEAYIAKCLDSVLSQSDETVEIICVNDSSPDKSRNIVIEYQKMHVNIKLIDRENGGLSAARNTGIKHATGKYIVFLDSDDYLTENVIGAMFEQMETQYLDVLVGNIQWVYDDGRILKEKQITHVINTIQSGEVCFNVLIETNYYVPMAYNTMCKREFIVNNNLYFKEGYIYEDEMWTPEILLKALRVNGFKGYHYNYLQRTNTIVNSELSTYKFKCLLEASNHILSLSEKYTNNTLNTKANLLVRACIIYGIARRNYIIGSNIAFDISVFKLLKCRLPTTQFDICIQNTINSKIKRRVLRILHWFL